MPQIVLANGQLQMVGVFGEWYEGSGPADFAEESGEIGVDGGLHLLELGFGV